MWLYFSPIFISLSLHVALNYKFGIKVNPKYNGNPWELAPFIAWNNFLMDNFSNWRDPSYSKHYRENFVRNNNYEQLPQLNSQIETKHITIQTNNKMKHLELSYHSLVVCNPLPGLFLYPYEIRAYFKPSLYQGMIAFLGDLFLKRQGMILNVFEYQEGLNQYLLILSSDYFSGLEFAFVLLLLCILGTNFSTRIMEEF